MIASRAQTARRAGIAARLIAIVVLTMLPPTARADDKPIVIASVGDVSSLDPHLLDSNHPTGSVIWSIFDSLMHFAAPMPPAV